jgi:hypothetical protein
MRQGVARVTACACVLAGIQVRALPNNNSLTAAPAAAAEAEAAGAGVAEAVTLQISLHRVLLHVLQRTRSVFPHMIFKVSAHDHTECDASGNMPDPVTRCLPAGQGGRGTGTGYRVEQAHHVGTCCV